MRTLVTSIYPVATLRQIPAFLSGAPSMTWLRAGLLVAYSPDREGNLVEFVLLIRFSLVWPLKLNVFAFLPQLWFRPIRVGSADWRADGPGHAP